MENAEEVMQLLEEFSKIKPKDIPRELEDYLCYVAKTGDPVYQWTLIKHLFREKLVTVITDFYESTPTIELPPCPNFEPFNYERRKTSLLKRFDSFSSAPFTVQRICELLTNPRKEYNRADKYMRAIEKNVLVVSTREPGSGKRSLECDSQSDTVLNGTPEIKSISDPGSLSLLHGPPDLPYLGAPPASNDVTVETTELNVTVNDKLDLQEPDNSKTWSSQESNPILTEDAQDNIGLPNVPMLEIAASEESNPTLTENAQFNIGLPNVPMSEITASEETNPILTEDAQFNIGLPNVPMSEIAASEVSLNKVDQSEVRCVEESNCDIDNKLVPNNDNESTPLITENLEGECSSDIFTHRPSCESVLPDSIDSSDSFQHCSEDRQSKVGLVESAEIKSVSDENEVSSTPEDVVEDSSLIQEEIEDPTDSEAEATDSTLALDAESDLSILPDNEINSSDTTETGQSNPVVISEIRDVKSDVGLIDLECNEITGTVDSPVSPEGNNASLHADNGIDQNVNLNIEQSDNPDSHPDSSNDVCLQERATVTESHKPETCIEADSVSDSNIILPQTESEVVENVLQYQNNDEKTQLSIKNNSEVSSPDFEKLLVAETCVQSPIETNALSSISSDEAIIEEQFSNPLSENTETTAEVQSSSEVAHEMCEQERREDTVIQSIPNILPDSQHHIEDINLDTNEEEAMDVDDCSNQMMVSEGENEGEPMDQSDQLHS